VTLDVLGIGVAGGEVGAGVACGGVLTQPEMIMNKTTAIEVIILLKLLDSLYIIHFLLLKATIII
jgi:hypothetical protein